MYVLHHADKPHIYSDLPDKPMISPVVRVWKGVTRTAGLTAMGLAAAVAASCTACSAEPTRSQPKTKNARRQTPRNRENGHER